MSLLLTNLATDKQKAILERLGYIGTGKYTIDKLSISEAADLITELFEEERLLRAADGIDALDDEQYPF